MKKYKLIKKYPGMYYNIGTIVIKKPNGWYELENSTSCANIPDNIENYPEFWEKVKEKQPLFINHDGDPVYSGDLVHQVLNLQYYSYHWSKSNGNSGIPWDIDKEKRFFFSTEETAKKFIKENSPQFSRNQVINILKGFDKEINEFTCENGELEYSKYIEEYKDNENLL